MDTLPRDCFNIICLYLELPDLARLATSCKANDTHCQSNELWNLLLCQRMWTVDPPTVLVEEDHPNTEDANHWQGQFRRMIEAERDYETYLTNLKNMNLEGWIERHFLGQLAPHWNGWERRFWAWTSLTSSFSAFSDASKFNCFATFPVSAASQVMRVSPEEQIALSNYEGDDRNIVTDPRPFVFTITKTSFPLLWACSSEEQLKLWLDKISVTLHPLQFEGQTYRAPARYAISK